jgi:hypothetical protein
MELCTFNVAFFFFSLFSRKINECKGVEDFLSKAAVAA